MPQGLIQVPWCVADSNDYFTSKARGSTGVRFSNVGAACCARGPTVDAADEGDCSNSLLQLNDGSQSPRGSCINDVCCDGKYTCAASTLSSVRSLSCRGEGACGALNGLAGSFFLEKDLYCNVDAAEAPADPTQHCCGLSDFFFEEDAEHCVKCIGHETCRESKLTFGANAKVNFLASGLRSARRAQLHLLGASSVRIHCFSATSDESLACLFLQLIMPSTGDVQIFWQCIGFLACGTADMTVTANSQARLECLRGSVGGTRACDRMQIKIESGGRLHLICDESSCTRMFVTGETSSCFCESDFGTCPTACSGFQPVEPPSDTPTRCLTNGIDTEDVDYACCAGNPQEAPDCSKCECSSMDVAEDAGAEGDPHVKPFNSKPYLLLKQGSFHFWGFSGLDAEVLSAKKVVKKLPVDFSMFAHYSGHASYTKGFLLVDNSGGTKQVLEVTARDCAWNRRVGEFGWSRIDGAEALLSVPDSEGDEMTAFKTVALANQSMRVELLMKTRDGSFKSVAKLFVVCKPSHFINLKLTMSKADMGFVQGQLKSDGHTATGEDRDFEGKNTLLQGMDQEARTDTEFLISKTWTELGGTFEGADYLNLVDEQGEASFVSTCSDYDMDEAKALCSKHLGEVPQGKQQKFQDSFDNCVFDVCNGGGEISAELAAEIFRVG